MDSSGNISFAATPYRVGNAMRGLQVQVRVVGDTVEISKDGRILRSHLARHDPAKERGAFANLAGRPQRINAASRDCHTCTGITTVARVPKLDAVSSLHASVLRAVAARFGGAIMYGCELH